MNKPQFYFIIVIISILQIVGGLFQIAGSLPLFTLYQNIKVGGIHIESDNVYIGKVMPLSPAAGTQLIAGDIIVSADGIAVSKPSDFTSIVLNNRGNLIEIVINRNGEFKQTQLIPRVNYPSNEGPTGVVISNSIFQKQSVYKLIPNTLIQNVSWDGWIEQKSKIGSPISVFWQKEYFRPFTFLIGSVLVILAIGLIKLKKWALYGTFILIIVDLIQMIIYFSTSFQYNSIFLITIVGSIVSILFVFYLYSQRKFFK